MAAAESSTGFAGAPEAALRFARVLPAAAESVRVVRHGVADLARRADAEPELLDDVLLAVSEAATNVVVHAYAEPGSGGTLRVDAHAREGTLQVSVEDDGPGVLPRTDSPGMGVGMALMAQLSDTLDVSERPDGGARIVMRFALRRPAGLESRT